MEISDIIQKIITENNTDFYINYINIYIKQIPVPIKVYCFIKICRNINYNVRSMGIYGRSMEKAERFLEIPRIFEKLVCLNTISYFWQDIGIIKKSLKQLHYNVNLDRDNEMAFCVEETFLKGIEEALYNSQRAWETNKKAAFQSYSEELIATTLSPERAQRMGERHGISAMDWLVRI